MTKDATFETLYGWGLEVAITDPNSIKNTAKKQESLGGTVKPGPTPDPQSWKKNHEKALMKKSEMISGGRISVLKAKKPVTVNGDITEWPLNDFNVQQKILLNNQQAFINAGKINDDSDFYAVIYAQYDDTGLYIAAQVTDDNLVKENECSNNWRNDCLEIWIDGADDDGTMTDNGGNDPDNYQLNIDVNGCVYVYRNNNSAAIKKNIQAAAKAQKNGYVLEVKIPFSSIPELDMKSKAGIGFSISFADADKITEYEWNHIL